ncbi:MAG TPA: hypothetical protein VGN61_14370 [Verrucomicrobiae bacterium]
MLDRHRISRREFTESAFANRGQLSSGLAPNESYCLGMITGWGGHHLDIAHWGVNMELSGPEKI